MRFERNPDPDNKETHPYRLRWNTVCADGITTGYRCRAITKPEADALFNKMQSILMEDRANKNTR